VNNLNQLVTRFFEIIKSYGVTSFVLICVFMIRSVFFDSPEQQEGSTQIMLLGGSILILCAVVELVIKKGKEKSKPNKLIN